MNKTLLLFLISMTTACQNEQSRKTFDGEVYTLYDDKGRVVEIYGQHPSYEDFSDPFKIKISYDSLDREKFREDYRFTDTTFVDTTLYYTTQSFYLNSDKAYFKQKLTIFRKDDNGVFQKEVKEIKR